MTPAETRRRKKNGFSHKQRRLEEEKKRDDNRDENTAGVEKKKKEKNSSKARKRRDIAAIGKLLQFVFILAGVFIGVSLAAFLSPTKKTNPFTTISTTSAMSAAEKTEALRKKLNALRERAPAMGSKQIRELERAREMLKRYYDASYAAIEREFSIFSDQSQLDAYAEAFSESTTERGRAAIWERAVEKFYSRPEYDVDGERGKQLREVQGSYVPEVSAKKQFAEDDPKRFKRLMELVRDKKENGEENAETEKGKKDADAEIVKDSKKMARSAALAAFVFEVLETLREEGSSYFAEAPPEAPPEFDF